MEVEKNLEVKTKCEKPQMEVVKLKPAYMVSACSSNCSPVCGPWDCKDW